VIRFLPELSRIRALPALVIRFSYEKGDNSIEALQKRIDERGRAQRSFFLMTNRMALIVGDTEHTLLSTTPAWSPAAINSR
jgi:hypothetical protein